MKYRTRIDIITDADSEREAADIAGEFLKGDFESGATLTCRTASFRSPVIVNASICLVLTLIFVGAATLGYFQKSPVAFTETRKISACSPPLKTSSTLAFKDAWQEEETKKVLDYVRK